MVRWWVLVHCGHVLAGSHGQLVTTFITSYVAFTCNGLSQQWFSWWMGYSPNPLHVLIKYLKFSWECIWCLQSTGVNFFSFFQPDFLTIINEQKIMRLKTSCKTQSLSFLGENGHPYYFFFKMALFMFFFSLYNCSKKGSKS